LSGAHWAASGARRPAASGRNRGPRARASGPVLSPDALGIRQISEVFAQLIAYIPNIIAAVLVYAAFAALMELASGSASHPDRE
jgi:hypothetical protein